MSDRIALAARNNALWCDAVARSHGIVATMDASAWTTPSRTPPYYPDAVTLSPAVGEYDVLARVDGSDGCSVKDSWARLDLSVEDFACLVVGEWVWLDPTTSVGSLADPWQEVRTAQDFTDWVAAWASEPDALEVLRPSLLGELGVHVLGARAGAAPDAPFTAGAIVNVTDDVAGLGNVFSAGGDDAATWRAAAAAARTAVGPMPLVGWEAGAGLDAAVEAGCERLGPLSVWLK